ncbi:MAG: PAS domain S-box protein [bacterium]|nr:PAS domain S-box protein [bacterium]
MPEQIEIDHDLRRQLHAAHKRVAELEARLVAAEATGTSSGLPVLKRAITMVMEAFVGLDGQWLQVPERLCDVLGYSEDELLEGSMFDFTHPDDIGNDERMRRSLLAGETETCEHEKRFIRGDGDVVWIYQNCNLVRDADGKPAYFLSYLIDITERVRTAQALSQSERRYRTLIENAPMSIHEIDLDGRLTAMNAPGQQFLGTQDGGDVVGTRYVDAVAESDRARVVVMFERALAGEPANFEFHAVGDPPRVFAANFMPLRDADGRIHKVMGIARDVTQKKRAEEQRTLMVHELDHRVKNTLATVLALYEQTLSASDSLDNFRDAYTARLRALARTHEALAEESWQGIDIREVVRLTVGPYLEEDGKRLRMEGTDLLLPSRTTTPLGLVLNELATNAAKHGSLSQPGGRIEVSWKLEYERELELNWTERGGPRIESKPDANGFGLRLVHGLVGHELEGVVEMDFDPRGITCCLHVPLLTR